MTEEMPEVPALQVPTSPVPVNNYYFVSIIDNIVYDKIKTDSQHAAILAAGPTFVQVPAIEDIEPGDIYDPETNTFSRPL